MAVRIATSRSAAFGVLALVAACGGGGDGGASGADPAAQTTAYTAKILVSDGAVPADHVDKNLVNPWGVAFNAAGPVWVANNGANNATIYAPGGATFFPAVPVPNGANGAANPTGLIYNTTLSFPLGPTGASALGLPANFIFCGEGGTLAAYGDAVDPLKAQTVYDDAGGGAVYKALAIAKSGGADFLYVTDFHNRKIDVFDSHFKKAASPGGFHDSGVPGDYAPFGIQNIGGQLFVTFAKQELPEAHDNANGAGLGIVDVFDGDGNLLRRFTDGGALNAPWGMVEAPADFGQFSKAILIGNFGDGRINAYDPASGAFLGALRDASGDALSYPGLWGIVFGNGNFGPKSVLFFAAGLNDEADGAYGRIDAAPK